MRADRDRQLGSRVESGGSWVKTKGNGEGKWLI